MNFNEMLDKCWETALHYEKEAKLYQGTSPASLEFISCIFRGRNNTSLLVKCTNNGHAHLKDLDVPYMDDLVIHPPIEITQEESTEYLYAQKHKDDWISVTIRKPLGPEPFNTLYIYTYPNNTYWAVDSTNGDVFPLF